MNRLKEYRQQQDLTKAEVARRSGVSASNVGRIERGEVAPSMQTARALASVFGVTVEDLFPEPQGVSA